MCIMLWKVGENRVLLKIHSNTFFVLYLLISPTKSAFLWEKNFGGTRHLCKKDEPTLDRSVGGGGGGGGRESTVRYAGS